MDDILLTFYNTHHSITAEQILLHAHICVKVMPMPEAIAAGCGLCLRLLENDYRTAFALLEREHILPRAAYKQKNGAYMQLDTI